MKTRLIFVALVILFVALMQLPWQWSGQSSRAFADEPAATPPASLVPGLSISFQNAAGETVDARDARLVALFVPQGKPVSPLIPPGPFQATWTGVLNNRIKDTCTFAAEGRGDLTVTLNDKPVLELHGDFANHPADPVVVKKGKNKLVVVYHAPADGDATVRLLWAPSGKTLEPVCATTKQMQLVHDSADPMVLAHQPVRQGRELVATLRCVNCHQGADAQLIEANQDAPNLEDLKSRLNQTWLAYWISNPKALRPTASMPALFHDGPASDQPTVDDRAGDIAAYLGSPDTPVTPASDPAILARGARLFTGLGCVACHVAPGVTDSDPTLKRVPLKYVLAKFKPDALKQFLKKPEAHYAWIKMPNFHLSDQEATALSAWLISSCKPDELPAITKNYNADNGKKLFETSGCMNCHAMGKSQSVMPKPTFFSKANFTNGCMADDRAKIGTGVDFGFTPEQRAAIRALVATDWKSALQNDSPAEFAARQITALRCNACHSIDGVDSAWSNLDTEITTIEQNLPPRADNEPEPKGDQSRPPLTWMGEKLRPGWIKAFIAGEIPYKPRTWLFARMPSFASRAYPLSKGMAMMHGLSGEDDPRPAPDAKLADIGKSLTSQAGLGCVKCHAVADQAAIAPFEAEAPNLARVDARLRHDYFTHWMRDPQYFLPGTKMPSFANVDGQTPLKDVLNGDAAAEYEAVWNYLRAGRRLSLRSKKRRR